MEVVHNEVLVAGYLLPFEVIYIHLLTRTVVDTSKNIDVVTEVVCVVQESSVRHLAQLNELHGFEVQHHGVLRTGAVIMASQDDHLV